MTTAYSGLRVLEFSQVLAGPYATHLLSMQGAEVTKIEPLGTGDQLRSLTTSTQASDDLTPPMFVGVNYGKKSLSMDLKAPNAREIVMRLAARSDVVVENFRPSVIERLGFGYQEFRKLRPDIIYCSVSGYGQNGTKSRRALYDGTAQAASGMMANNGHPETGPTRTGYTPVDLSTGIMAAFAIASALFRRSATGQGQFLDVAMMDTAIALQIPAFTRFLMEGEVAGLEGNRSFIGAPTADTFATADGHLLVAAITDAQGNALLRSLGLSDLLERPAFADSRARLVNASLVKESIQRAFLQNTSDHWVETLSPMKIPVEKVRNVREVCEDPHFESRHIISEIPAPDNRAGTIKSVGAPFMANVDGPAVPGAPPSVGEHTEAILHELGFSDTEISDMRKDGTLSR